MSEAEITQTYSVLKVEKSGDGLLCLKLGIQMGVGWGGHYIIVDLSITSQEFEILHRPAVGETITLILKKGER